MVLKGYICHGNGPAKHIDRNLSKTQTLASCEAPFQMADAQNTHFTPTVAR